MFLRQRVYADPATPYKVRYRMGKAQSGEWKLLIVIIESVSLGDVYRDQFPTSA